MVKSAVFDTCRRMTPKEVEEIEEEQKWIYTSMDPEQASQKQERVWTSQVNSEILSDSDNSTMGKPAHELTAVAASFFSIRVHVLHTNHPQPLPFS